MAIWFQAVRWKNFLSTGNAFTEIRLDKSPSTLIIGKNGDGKSTLGDAICFAGYGKPYRKIKKMQLINSINGGGLETELEFIGHDRKQYLIRRGLKPDFFEIYRDGELIDQDAAARDYQAYLEHHILRMNFKTFTQIVFLGSASFVPFMQLPTAVRREFIEDLLDIRVFSTMNALLKDKIINNRSALTLQRSEIDSATHIKAIYAEQQEQEQSRLEENQRQYEREVHYHTEKKQKLEHQFREQEQAIKTLEAGLVGEEDQQELEAEMASILKDLRRKETKLTTNAEFFETNAVCPTCEQGIPEIFRRDHVHDTKAELEKVQAGISQLTEELVAVRKDLQRYTEIKAKIAVAVQENNDTAMAIRDEDTALKLLAKTFAANTSSTDNISERVAEVEKKLADLIMENAKTLADKETMDIASIILRDDGIKTKIIKQYITIINQLVNKYLASLDFFVSFELNENFEEIIRSRHRDEFSYENFSEGEKMRIDLAILFTWRSIAKMKNSAATNLLVLDEVFDASLDAAGCEEFLKLIHSLEDCSVFVISHKTDILVDKFKEVIRFEKQKSFSRIVC